MIRFDRILWHVLSVCAVTVVSQTAGAQQQISISAAVPVQPTNWATSVSIPKFDPDLGTLQGIQLTVAAEVHGSAAAENTALAPIFVSLNFQSTVTLTRPDGTVLVIAIPRQSFTDTLGAFDGEVDFHGLSGVMHRGITAQHSASVHSPPPASDLGLFTGSPGNVGNIVLPISAAGTSTHNGSGNLVIEFLQQASAMITVVYTYAPTVQAYCFGDGSGNGGTDCPCGNSVPGNPAGCLNSTGHGGLLSSSGIPSISNDTFHLMTSQLPPGVPGFFFQGTSGPAGHHTGGGVVFGGGLLCLGGAIVRMGKFENPPGGSSVLPFAGDPPLSVQFNLHAGDERNYQVWYRDGHGPCGLAFNTTNGLRMHWLP